jgi:16S rRNA (uracil1498-N3)-methyltransferase
VAGLAAFDRRLQRDVRITAMRRFYAPPQQIGSTTITLSEDESRHLTVVLRLESGDEVNVFDGCGREFSGTVASAGKRVAEITITGQVSPPAPESPLSLHLCSTVLPGDKYDLVVQKSVELGIVTLTPLITARCEVKAKDAERRLERWRRIALEATKQCGRSSLMEITPPAEFNSVLADLVPDRTIMFSERDGGRLPQELETDQITALIGPKGGWADDELNAAGQRSVTIATLGGRILRAETAAIALTALLQHRFGDFN